MKQRWFTALAALVGLLLPMVGVDGQLHPATPEDGFFDLPIPTSAASLTECVTLLSPATTAPATELGCEVVDVTRLGQTDQQQAWMVKYRRQIATDYEQFVDTLSIDEFVLVRQDNEGDFVLLWHLPQAREYAFLEQLDAAERDEGILVSYFICLNGTGGCAQHFLLGSSQWSVAAQLYVEELRDHLPTGGSLHKGRRVDPNTLEGTQPVALPGDANCCPSASLRFRVILDGGHLRLAEAALTTNRPY